MEIVYWSWLIGTTGEAGCFCQRFGLVPLQASPSMSGTAGTPGRLSRVPSLAALAEEFHQTRPTTARRTQVETGVIGQKLQSRDICFRVGNGGLASDLSRARRFLQRSASRTVHPKSTPPSTSRPSPARIANTRNTLVATRGVSLRPCCARLRPPTLPPLIASPASACLAARHHRRRTPGTFHQQTSTDGLHPRPSRMIMP